MAVDGVNAYFEPILPWQQATWERLTGQFFEHKLPHALLADGVSGIGKRAFVWRLVAWLLCEQRTNQSACGVCNSCTWLKAGTHPDLLVVPNSHAPHHDTDTKDSIKIDDIRYAQEYSHTKGDGWRIIVLDDADTLTIAAANALLKTLEEPRFGVCLILISDYPSRLLPTIKSRTQSLLLQHFDPALAMSFLQKRVNDDERLQMALQLSDFAPLSALTLLNSSWFERRDVWLKTLVALWNHARTPIAASEYWQSVLGFDEFLKLTQMMMLDVYRVVSGLSSMHTDLDVMAMVQKCPRLTADELDLMHGKVSEMVLAVRQNVQEKMAYDALMCVLAGVGRHA